MSYYSDIKKKYNIDQLSLFPDISKATLRLELSNNCNHRCIFCLNSEMPRVRREMPEEMVYDILGQACAVGIKRAGLFINGEPFISKHLPDYIRFCKEHGMEYVFITTNGALATKERLTACIEAGVDSIKFSINAGSRESYQKVHGSDDYEKVLSHLRFAHDYKRTRAEKLPFRLLASCVVTDDVVDEINTISETVGPLVDDLLFFHAHNFGGQAESDKAGLQTKFQNNKVTDFYFNKVVPCPYLFNLVCITCEGYMTLCIEEVNNKMVFADLSKVSLMDAWHSEIMVRMREKHIENKLQGTQCYNCVYHVYDEVAPLNEELYRASQREGK